MGIEPGFSVDHPSSEFGHSDSKQPIFDDHRPDQRDHSEGLVEYERGVTECKAHTSVCTLCGVQSVYLSAVKMPITVYQGKGWKDIICG